jgi:hypothetical protein
VPPPWNWALGLSIFQVFFLPTGWCYWKASETCPGDIIEVEELLERRAGEAVSPRFGGSPAEGGEGG